MRIRNQTHCQSHGPNPIVTLRSLFSRRSKRGRTCKPLPSPSHRSSLILSQSNVRNDAPSTSSSSSSSSSNSTLRTVRANGHRLDKELEVLGLLTDPRKDAQPVFLGSVSTTTPAAHSPPTFPVAGLHEEPFWPSLTQTGSHEINPHGETIRPAHGDELDHLHGYASGYEYQHEHYPPSPLLPPPPTLTLAPSTPFQDPFQDPFQHPISVPPPKADDIPPPSPALSSRTFATRSSGIFPWGAEPNTVDDAGFADGFVSDALSDDQVLVLPSPPRGAGLGSYRWLPAGIH